MGKDKISKEKRSHIMSCIRSKDTKVELKLRNALWRKGYRYRTHHKLPGSPDLVFTKKKTVIFVDGTFWHGYNFKNLKPKLKNKFWVDKITGNIERDKKVNAKLLREGWNIIRLWEHEINDDLNYCIEKVETELKKDER